MAWVDNTNSMAWAALRVCRGLAWEVGMGVCKGVAWAVRRAVEWAVCRGVEWAVQGACRYADSAVPS